MNPVNRKIRKAWANSVTLDQKESDGLIYKLHDNHRIYVMKRESPTSLRLLGDIVEPKGRWSFFGSKKVNSNGIR